MCVFFIRRIPIAPTYMLLHSPHLDMAVYEVAILHHDDRVRCKTATIREGDGARQESPRFSCAVVITRTMRRYREPSTVDGTQRSAVTCYDVQGDQ